MAPSKRSHSALFAALIAIGTAFGQECQFVDPPPPPQQLGGGGGGNYASWNGWYLPTSGTLRILVVLIEQDGAAGSTEWPAHSLPVWVNNSNPNINLFDHNVPSGTATGLLTRYFQDASSGQFNVIADYLLSPNNGGIFHTSFIPNPQIPDLARTAAITAVNLELGTSIVTGHGFTSINDFDKWETATTTTGAGLAKNPIADGKYDHVMFIWRTAGAYNNNGSASSHMVGSLLNNEGNTSSLFFSHNGIPIDIMRHEFSHLLYGGNNFHTGGGGWNTGGQYFITLGNGWSNMGLANASLNSWNGWDRQRMGWKASGSSYEITARDDNNTTFQNGDLDASVPGGAGDYTLRDFVTTGDAIRIKLPFTDANTEYPEFLWVENHQGQAQNSNPFDKWIHEPDLCIGAMVPGLQMYVQIDKEVRQATSSGPIYAGPGDYIRPLDASGHYDLSFDLQSPYNNCVSWNNTYPASVQGNANPFTGSADRHWTSDDYNATGTLTHGDVRLNTTFRVGSNPPYTYLDNLFYSGHTRQVFTLAPGGNHKVGVGTNPSSATMMNLVGYDVTTNNQPNLRRIYLNGVSVELLAQNTDGSIQVRVRFDDPRFCSRLRGFA